MVVFLPWKEPHPNLPDSYHLTKNRLRGLLSRLKQNPSVLKDYDTTIWDQLSQEIVEVVNEVKGQTPGATQVEKAF